MSIQYEQVKEIKVRVYKWKETMIHEKFSDCGFLQCTIINEIMHVQKSNQDFLEASTELGIFNLEPIMDYLPCSHECSFQTWYSLCSSLLLVNGEGLVGPVTATRLSEIISAYLVSNYHAVQGTRDFKIVVELDVYVKTIIEESPEIGPGFSFSEEDGSMIGDLLGGDHYGLDQTAIISPVHDFLLDIELKVGYFNEFFANDRNSLLNRYPSSGGGWINGKCIFDWLKNEPHLLCQNPEQDSWYQEVKPALKMKKYDASCSKNSEDSRAICLEEICEGDSVAVTPCSHIFHCNSILDWLAEKMTCPMCRTVCPVHI